MTLEQALLRAHSVRLTRKHRRISVRPDHPQVEDENGVVHAWVCVDAVDAQSDEHFVGATGCGALLTLFYWTSTPRTSNCISCSALRPLWP